MRYSPVGVKLTQLVSCNGGTLHICAYCMATWLTSRTHAYRGTWEGLTYQLNSVGMG